MKRMAAIGAVLAAGAALAGLRAATARSPSPTPAITEHPTVWRWPAGAREIALWPGSPPDAADSGPEPESATASINPKRFAGRPVTAIMHVSRPTITVFPAKGTPTGAALVVFPGGGFQELAIDLEGTETCDWITPHGVACVVVKYRVPNSNHHYDAKCDCGVLPPHLTALEDAQRAIRLVRAKAGELHIDPGKIGVIGYSAGGYLVAQTSNIVAPAYAPVDAIDRISSRPNFALALYPGHLCRKGQTLDPTIHVTKETPPTFLVQAWDDPVDEICNSTLYARALDDAGVPSEVHLFARGGHAFGHRPTGLPVSGWPALAEAWLRGLGQISPVG